MGGHAVRGIGSGVPPGIEKEDRGAAGLCTGSRLIHFSDGQQCRGHRENKRSRAGVWRKSYKVYKESVSLQ
jgi:hypothetical protein